jgi:ribonuclease BN (tRNA processing enzyme)
LVTHIHEDHMGGLTACLARARAKSSTCRLWITRPSLAVLEQRLAAIAPDLYTLIQFQEIVPGQPIALGEATLVTRLNHHVLPCGTLGLKLDWNGRSVGISGDTKYDEAIVRQLRRPELEAEWFGNCQLVFHEVDPTRPRSVHSYYLEVLKLAKRLPGRLVVYHAVGNVSPLEMAAEGQWYDV